MFPSLIIFSVPDSQQNNKSKASLLKSRYPGNISSHCVLSYVLKSFSFLHLMISDVAFKMLHRSWFAKQFLHYSMFFVFLNNLNSGWFMVELENGGYKVNKAQRQGGGEQVGKGRTDMSVSRLGCRQTEGAGLMRRKVSVHIFR